MTKKHFKLIAHVIASMPKEARADIAQRFAHVFRNVNPRFDEKRFLAACEVEAPQS